MEMVKVATDVEKNIYDEAVNALRRYGMDVSQALKFFVTVVADRQILPISWDDGYVTSPQEDE